MLLTILPQKIITWPNPLHSPEPLVRFGAYTILVLLVLIVTLAIAHLISGRLWRLLHAEGIPINVALLLGRGARISVWTVGAIVTFYILGVGLTPITAFIGIIGLAASLSLQTLLQNLVAGVYLLAEHPFRIGDIITIAGDNAIKHVGKVEDIQMRITRLRGLADEEILVPNGFLFTSTVTNTTAAGGYVTQVKMTFPRTTDPATVRQKMFPLLERGPSVLRRPKPVLEVQEIAEKSWIGCVSFWVETPNSASDTLWNVGHAFPQVKISTDSAAS